MDTESRESLLVENYTRGLSSYDTKHHVRLNQPLTPDKAISFSMQSEEYEISIPTENPVIPNKATLYRAILINGFTGKKIQISLKMQRTRYTFSLFCPVLE